MKVSIIIYLLFAFFISSNSFATSDNKVNMSNAQKLIAKNAIYKSIYKINQFSNVNYSRPVMQKFIITEILPLFDFKYMSAEILKNIPNSRQKLFLIAKIKNDIVTTVLQGLLKAKGSVFIPIGIKMVGNNIALRLKIKNKNIDLILHNSNHTWQIFDIIFRGQSLINYYKYLIFKNKL